VVMVAVSEMEAMAGWVTAMMARQWLRWWLGEGDGVDEVGDSTVTAVATAAKVMVVASVTADHPVKHGGQQGRVDGR